MAVPESEAAVVPPAAATRLSPGRRVLVTASDLWAWLFLGLMILFFVISVPLVSSATFVSVRNSQNILIAITPVVLLGLGQTFVIISAGIDLSVGWVMSFASVISALAIRSAANAGLPVYIAVIWGLLVGTFGAAFIGVINGTIIAKLKVPAFIVTLGISFIMRGVALLWSENTTVIGLPDIRAYGNESLFYYVRGTVSGGFYFLHPPPLATDLLRPARSHPCLACGGDGGGRGHRHVHPAPDAVRPTHLRHRRQPRSRGGRASPSTGASSPSMPCRPRPPASPGSCRRSATPPTPPSLATRCFSPR